MRWPPLPRPKTRGCERRLADAKGESLRFHAQRTAISGEDWRYSNGFDVAMKFFEPVRAALAPSAAVPDTEAAEKMDEVTG